MIKGLGSTSGGLMIAPCLWPLVTNYSGFAMLSTGAGITVEAYARIPNATAIMTRNPKKNLKNDLVK
jgi:hypothetical protein